MKVRMPTIFVVVAGAVAVVLSGCCALHALNVFKKDKDSSGCMAGSHDHGSQKTADEKPSEDSAK